MNPRTCPACDKPLTQHPNESTRDYNRRRTCGNTCAREARKRRPHDFAPPQGNAALYYARPHYPARIARQLAELAESRPTPETYARERARILEAQ
jgi:hypothetical protein